MTTRTSRRDLFLSGAALAAAAVALAPGLARGATNVGPLQPRNNLADLDAIPTARFNLKAISHAADRTALAALTGSVDTLVWLDGISGGMFEWSSANLSSRVTSDPLQGVNVAPASDTTGASGAYVRTQVNQLTPQMFGALANGSADDAPEINAAITYLGAVGGGILFFPPGTYRTASTVTCQVSNVILRGAGAASIIKGDLAVDPIIKFGDAGTVNPVSYCGLETLVVDRAAGTPGLAVVGVLYSFIYYFTEQSVLVKNSGINRHLTGVAGSTSLGWEGYDCYSTNARKWHMQLTHIAEVRMIGGGLGVNGSELYDCDALLLIGGNCNAVEFTNVSLIPRGPGVSKPSMLKFENLTNATGVFTFLCSLAENISTMIESDAGSPIIADLAVIGGRYVADTALFDMNAASFLYAARFDGVKFAGPGNLVSPFPALFSNCVFFSDMTFTGSGTAGLSISNCIFQQDLLLTNAWGKLVVDISNIVDGTFTDSSTGTRVIANINRAIVPANITVTASPMLYLAGATAEMVAIKGGTVSGVVVEGITMATQTNCTIMLDPQQGLTVTYTVAPTMSKKPQ